MAANEKDVSMYVEPKPLLQALEEEYERLLKLPGRSRYVIHRLRVVQRATELAEQRDANASSTKPQHEDELSSLLKMLQI